MNNLTNEEVLSVLIEKKMRPGKRRWSYRCPHCQNVFDSETFGKYVLIDTYKLAEKFNLSVKGVHEGTLFCSIECATAAIKATDIYTMYEDSKEIITSLSYELSKHEQVLQYITAYLKKSTLYSTQEVQEYATTLLKEIKLLKK